MILPVPISTEHISGGNGVLLPSNWADYVRGPFKEIRDAYQADLKLRMAQDPPVKLRGKK